MPRFKGVKAKGGVKKGGEKCVGHRGGWPPRSLDWGIKGKNKREGEKWVGKSGGFPFLMGGG